MDALGGTSEVAAITGSKPSAVWNWKAFNAFPPRTYLAMTTALAAKGIIAPPSLWKMIEPSEFREVAE